MKGQDLTEALDMETAVPVTGQPGDCLLFSTYTVHGSRPNTTEKPRRAYINGFLRASASLTPDCEWTFRDGAPVPLPSRYCTPSPLICHYPQMRLAHPATLPAGTTTASWLSRGPPESQRQRCARCHSSRAAPRPDAP